MLRTLTARTLAVVVAAVGVVAAASPAHAESSQVASAPDEVVTAVPTSAPDVPDGTPTYSFTKPDNRTSGDVTIMADLPFSYTFEYEHSMYGRNFYQTRKVCNDINLRSYKDIKVSLWRNVWGSDQKVGPTVWYSRGWHTWCWDAGDGAATYYFYFENGYALGSGYVHNP